MKITEYIEQLRGNVQQARALGKKIILIPTMGSLHYGHLGMVEAARKEDEDHLAVYIVMSIFVNPLQFGPTEDFEKYPRDLIRDSRLAQEAGADLLFAPSVQEMYPDGQSLTTVLVSKVSEGLCGAHRPGHFQGVTTVVSKLFHIVLPDIAYFGQKDYQQAMVIQQMVKDLNFPIQLILQPTVREADGLALSSRNVYLNAGQRQQAPVLYQALQDGAVAIQAGERSPKTIRQVIEQRISQETDGQIEYIEVRQAEQLIEIERITGPVVIALAVRFGATRLIDNILVEV